jgi:hypothetical protein
MQSENGVLIDVGQVRQVVENADVFVIGFSNFPERLLVDARTDAKTGPLVQVVEPLGSIEERLFWLGKERGNFGMPQSFTFFAWPHSISYLQECGIWQRARDRVNADGDAAAAQACDAALERLDGLDRAVLVAAVKGERYVTLWPPEPEDE